MRELTVLSKYHEILTDNKLWANSLYLLKRLFWCGCLCVCVGVGEGRVFSTRGLLLEGILCFKMG